MPTDDPHTQVRVAMDERSGRRPIDLPADPFLPCAGGNDRIQVLGHRGYEAPGCPENSVAAVTEALLQGADGVEIDVRLTADGTLVCTHDSVARTRTGARQAVASSASGDLLGADGRTPLATLADVLAAAQRPDGARVVVEAKPVTDAAAAARTASALAEVLGTCAGNARITVSSFDPALLGRIRAACADLPVRTALLGDRTDPVADVVRRAHEDGHDEVHLPLVGVRRTPQVVETAHALGLEVVLWTVNRRPELQWVADLGADAVITDDVLTAWSELDRAVVDGFTELTAA
jgi:glycerophosphoryl diester phosphodiesterase